MAPTTQSGEGMAPAEGDSFDVVAFVALCIEAMAAHMPFLSPSDLVRLPPDTVASVFSQENLGGTEDKVFDLIRAYIESSAPLTPQDVAMLWRVVHFGQLSKGQLLEACSIDSLPKDVLAQDLVLGMPGDIDVDRSRFPRLSHARARHKASQSELPQYAIEQWPGTAEKNSPHCIFCYRDDFTASITECERIVFKYGVRTSTKTSASIYTETFSRPPTKDGEGKWRSASWVPGNTQYSIALFVDGKLHFVWPDDISDPLYKSVIGNPRLHRRNENLEGNWPL